MDLLALTGIDNHHIAISARRQTPLLRPQAEQSGGHCTGQRDKAFRGNSSAHDAFRKEQLQAVFYTGQTIGTAAKVTA